MANANALIPSACDKCGRDYDRPLEPLNPATARGESETVCDDCRKTPPATKEFCVWADHVQRVYQDVEADSPQRAYALAKKHVGCWEPCEEHSCNGYRLSNEIQGLATGQFIAVHGARHCRMCGSEIVETINDSNFRDGECGACEYERYKSQPALMKECETQLENWRMLRDDDWNGSQERIRDAMNGLIDVLQQAHGLNK